MDADNAPALGHGKIRLLEQIEQTGSISAAGRALGMSYRRTWLLVDSVNRLFAEPVVAARPGGGGGARLTESGRAVLALYRQAEQQAKQGAADSLRRLEEYLAPVAP